MMKLGTEEALRVLYAPVIEPGFMKCLLLRVVYFISCEFPLTSTSTPSYRALLERASSSLQGIT